MTTASLPRGPLYIRLEPDEGGLPRPSTVLLDQIQVMELHRRGSSVGKVGPDRRALMDAGEWWG